MFECVVCSAGTRYEDTLSVPQDCLHNAVVCDDCMQQYIASEVKSGNWQAIKCQASECNYKFKARDIKAYADDETLNL